MTTTILPNKKRIPHAAILSLIICLIFGYLTLRDIQRTASLPDIYFYYYFPIYAILFLYSLILFAASTADYFWALTSKYAVLTLTENEIQDSISLFSCGSIPWHEVQQIGVTDIFQYKMLVISLKDPGKILQAQPFWKRMVLKKHLKKFGTPVVISATRIDYDFDKLINIFRSKISTT